jgi:hypothetical protein
MDYRFNNLTCGYTYLEPKARSTMETRVTDKLSSSPNLKVFLETVTTDY